MKELIKSLIASEKTRQQRFSEFYEFFKETITTLPTQILSKIDSFQASKYIYAPWVSDFDEWEIEFNLKDLEWWESKKDDIIIKKNGLSKLKGDLKLRLEVLNLSFKQYLDDEK